MTSATKTSPAPQQVALPSRIAFGVGDFGFLLVWQGTTLFLMYFYTDVLGISPAVAGLIYMTAMVWDAITDPIIATIAERSNSRWGKYRPWIFAGALPFGLSYVLAFTTPIGGLIVPWLWALMTHILLRTAYTVASMPFNAMQARLTSNAHERTVLSGFRAVGAASGALAISFLTPTIVFEFGQGDEQFGYLIAAALAGALASVGLLYCAIVMREPANAAPSTVSASFFTDLIRIVPVIAKNDQLLRVLGIIVMGSICMGMFGKNVLYFFKYDVGQPDLATPALVLPAFLMIVFTPVWVQVAKRLSKANAMMIGLGIALSGYIAFFFAPSENLAVVFVLIAIIGIGASCLPVIFWAMVPDTIDYGELQTNVRAETRTFGLATFAQKAAVGVNALLLGSLLTWAGFEANTDQSEQTLEAMRAIMALVPAVGVIALLWLLHGYKLDQLEHRRILTELGR